MSPTNYTLKQGEILWNNIDCSFDTQSFKYQNIAINVFDKGPTGYNF